MTGGKMNPGLVEPEVAARALSQVNDHLAVGGDEELRLASTVASTDVVVVPKPALELLAQILEVMASGQGVQIVPVKMELTTQQAADLLNVSRPYLIGLLERGEIEYRLVGKHRRIQRDKLMEYIYKDDLKRKESLANLSRLSQTELD
ncbi:excisionase family DNA-binding protein [Lentzea sp. NPDC055074]